MKHHIDNRNYMITEFQVFRSGTNKEKGLRVFMLNGKPILQLKSVKSRYSKDIDISVAPKLFFPIDGELFRFKILLGNNSDRLDFYCTDRQIFESCVTCINTILEKFHTTNSPLNSKRYTFWSSSSSSNSESSQRQSEYSEIDINGNQEKGKDPSIYERIRKTSNDNKVKAQNPHYNVPDFNINETPLDWATDRLSNAVENDIPGDCEINIIKVLKLQEEMSCAGGVVFKVSREIMQKIEVMEYKKLLWNSELKIQDKRFHVGDRICTINNKIVATKTSFLRCCLIDEVNLRIQRLPKAKVFAISKESLKTCYTTDLVFKHPDYQFKDTWMIYEIDSSTHVDERMIRNTIEAGLQYHMIILHKNSFIREIRDPRKSKC